MLTHQTALGFWRSEHACKAVRLKREGSGPLIPRAVSAFDASAVRELASTGDGAFAVGTFPSCELPVDTPDAAVLPIHLLVSCDSGRHRAKGIAVHTCRLQLPPSALFAFQVDGLGKVGVVSPEVCLGQLSRSLTFEETLLLAFELCGTYRRVGAFGSGPGFAAGAASDFGPWFAAGAGGVGGCSNPGAGRTVYGRSPLTTAARLRTAAQRLPSQVFPSRARNAARFVLDDSRSPMESVLAALLTLPCAKGGYALPPPVLNPPIRIGARSVAASAGERYFCDLCWMDRKVALEYDSNQEHTGADRITHDAIRYNNLKSLQFEVFVATWGQLRSLPETDRLAASLARALGVRQRIRVNDYRGRQIALRRALGIR